MKARFLLSTSEIYRIPIINKHLHTLNIGGLNFVDVELATVAFFL